LCCLPHCYSLLNCCNLNHHHHHPLFHPSGPPARKLNQRGYSKDCLPQHLTDLSTIITCLEHTIRGHEQHGRKPNFKQKLQFKFWNQRSLPELRRLLVIACRIRGAQGTFVAQQELLALGRGADASFSSALRADCRAGGASAFGRWLLCNLSPGVDRYQQDVLKQTVGVSFYMHPQTPGQLENIRRSYVEASGKAQLVAGKAAIASIDVNSYLALLPSQAQQRIIVSLISDIAQSQTFLQKNFGWSPLRQRKATDKVSVALLASSKFEIMGLGVRSDMTAAHQHTDKKQRHLEEVASALSDDHAGDRASVLDACEGIGVDLGAVIEDAASLLGRHRYDSSDGGGGGAGAKRDNEQVYRNCTWGALASEVETVLRREESKKCGGGVWNGSTGRAISMSEGCLRTYCQATALRSLQGKRHNTVANVGHRKLQAAPGEAFLIDGRSSNARIRNFELAILTRISEHSDGVIHSADDHSKWKPDQSRPFTRKATILCLDDRQGAPYSDMKSKVPGINATTSSQLYVFAPDASQAGTDEVRKKRSVSVQKVPVAVQRLLYERPSTGIQQMNDHLYAAQSDARLAALFAGGACKYKLKITDGGSDQNPRNDEVKFADTYDHTTSGRIMDIHGTRCAGLSPLNEAEHVNGAETSALTKAEAPSMLAAGVPTSPEELRRNARQFGQAITNAIGAGGRYAGKAFLSIYSHPDLPPEELKKSETISTAMRIAVRAINDKWQGSAVGSNRAVVDKMAMADQIVPVKLYADLHMLCGHYSNQLSRFSCRRTLGHLCCPQDYRPFQLRMPFKSCSELSNLESEDRLCASFIPDAKKKADGHYESWVEVEAAVAAGTRVVTYQEPTPSLELKRYFKDDSQIPSPEEIARLAKDVYFDDSEGGREMVSKWFAQRRLDVLLMQEEKRKAALESAKAGAVAVEATVERIVGACAKKIQSVRSKSGLFRRSQALLRDIKTVAVSGSKEDMVRRIFDMKEYIIAAYNLDEAEVYPPVVLVEDSHVCATCSQACVSVNNPLLECAAQCDKKHRHMLCVGLAYVPRDWLCASCVSDGVMVIRHVLGKRLVRDRTEYKVGWVGREAEDPTWQALRDIPAGSRYLVNGYNARLRSEQRSTGESTAVGSNNSVHDLVGKEVAKDFSHGAVYTGYVTAHYPPELQGDEMTEELFHIEYDDGDEEEFNEQEVLAAIALAASRRGAAAE